MAEADQKVERNIKIAMVVITVLMLAMTCLGLFHTNLHTWYKNAGVFFKVVGPLAYVANLFFPAASEWITEKTQSEKTWATAWVIGLLVSVGLSAGFNFDL